MKKLTFFLCAVFLTIMGNSYANESLSFVGNAMEEGNGTFSSFQGLTWNSTGILTWSGNSANRTLAGPGDTCNDPAVIGSLPFTVTDNTSNYGDDYESGDRPPLAPGAVGDPSAYYLGGDDVVYSYTPSANGSVDISVTNHGTYTGVFVFTGCPFASTVGGHTASGAATALEVNGLPVQAGVTYYIVISTWPTPQSTTYTLNVSVATFDCPELEANYGSPCDDGNPNTVNDTVNENCECVGIPVASNDEACTATSLACGDSIQQSLVGATESLDDSCYGTGTADVWFTFTTDGSQIMTVAETSTFDAVVQLFKGNDCGNLVEAGVCKDSPENYTVTEAGTYYFRVRPYSSSNNEGTIVVGLTCVDYDCPGLQANYGDACDDGDPNTVGDAVNENCECEGIVPGPGADCATAISLDCNADPVTYSSIGSTATNTTTCSMGNAGLWFTFTGTGNTITINSTAAFDHEMSINSGACGQLTNIACKDGSTGAETYTLATTVSGQEYYVYIARFDSGSTVTGNITVSLVCATSFDCPELQANIGDSCDLGGGETGVVDANCNCVEISCQNTSKYPSAAVTPNADGSSTQIASCTFYGEYSEIGGIISGYEYQFNAVVGATSGYITVREGSVGGSVVAKGYGPLTITAPSSSNLFVHWNSNDTCGSGINCVVTTVSCVTCANAPDCEGVPGGPAQPGTPCDDGDPNTFNDVYDEDCNCAGVVPGPGDDCSMAIALDCNTEAQTFSSANSLATNTTTCLMGAKGIWFSFEGTGADITVNSSATFDHEMSINTGSCGELINIACKDGSTGAETYTVAGTVAGQTYYVYIAHYSSSGTTTGNITISLDCAVVPDCVAPTMSAYASDDVGEPIQGCIDTGGEYYVYATLSGGSGNTSYNVSANGGDPVEVDANDSVNLGPFTVGTNVSVTAVGVQDGDCSASASVTSPALCPPTNDEACGATVLACGDSIVQSLAGATASIEDNCFGSGSADVWFTFTADGSQAMKVAETSSFDAIVHLFKGDDCGDLEEVGACKDSPENYTVTDAGTYYFRVRPYSSFNDSGTITVSLTCVDRPTNDNCANAIVLECNADPVTYSSVGSAAVAPSGCSIGASGIWFSFVGTGADITINSTASFDHKMSMQTGSCNELTWIACRDGSSGAETYTIEASVADQMYYVYVAHWSASTSSTGDITISIDCAVVPECEAPTLTLAAQDANGGSIDCLEFDGDYYVLATLSGGSGNTSYYVTANDYNAVEVNADGSVVVGPFDAGTAVDVTATGVQDGDCSVSATINSPAVCPPSNDDPEDAVLLACGDSYEGSTAAATQSMGATQLCATFSSGYSKDVWFAFVADGISEYTFQGSGFDGVIEVYSGPVDGLTAIGCVDQYGQSDEIILADLDEGTYYVRYFAYSTSNAGDYTFSLSCYTPELCDEVDAGIASASTDVVCAGVSFTLSVEGSTMDDEDIVGLTGQWQAMINGDWTDISGANGVSYTVANGITEQTSYRFVLTCSEGNSDTSNSVTVSINPDVSQCYCEPSFPSAVEPITYVGFEDIDNTTSATLNGTPALEDFTDQTAFVAQGGEYPIEVKGNTNGNFTTKIVVYIDWNQDGIFDNSQGSNEMYLLPDIRNSNGQDGISSEGTIAVPATALLGNTRMRVMKKFGSVPGPCNASGYGQAEDYTVNVGTDEPEPCLAPESVVVSDITANSAQISWSGGSEEGYWIIAYGPAPYYPAEDDGENGYYGGNMTETLTGLEPGTEYNVYVRAMCQESYDNLSDWTSASFTTDEEPCVISGQIIGLYVDEPATVCQDAGELIVWWDSLGDYGEKMAFIITDQNNNILDIINEDFDTANVMEVTADFTGYDEGDYLIQHITWNGEITGLVVGNNTSEVEGDCKAWAVNQIGVTVEDCTVVPECESPLGITVDNITEDGADITWSAANAGDNQWQISLTVGGQGPDEGIIASVSGTPAYTATGLDPATTYTVYLRTVCSSEVSSDWAFNGEFTTLEAEEECESPLGITVDNITEDGAEITWSAANAGDDQWEISLTVGGQTADQGIIATVTGTPTYTATGLDPDTTYTVYLRTICSSEVSSDWAFNGDFTTLEAEEPGSCEGIDAFVTTWTTTASGQSITIPTYSGETYDYTVDWGDGSSNTNVPGNISHTYANAGTYTVSICGTFPRIYFNNGGDRLKIKSIEQWGTNVWSSMNSAFMGAENLVSHATDMPNLSMVTDMYGMFAFARKFNGDAQFGNWNVGNVTNMKGMFGGASVFNYPIGGWNVGNVTNMEDMFNGATLFNRPLDNWNVGNVTSMMNMFKSTYRFNQNLNSWDVSNVTNMNSMFMHSVLFNGAIGSWDTDNVVDMYGMFAYAAKFNKPIGNWDVSNVTSMKGMFGGASVFDQAIGNWNVGNVTTMEQMFHGASKFNQDLSVWNTSSVTSMKNMFMAAGKFNSNIGNWDVSNVTDMINMFYHANSFDQDLGSWNVGKVSNMRDMFKSVKLSTANYDSLLNGWASLPLKSNVKFSGGNSNYCAGQAARQFMISTYNWTIVDGGMSCAPPFTADMLDGGNSAPVFTVSLYPNPMKDQLNLGNPKNVELESISIFDLTGRMVQKVDLNGMTTGTVIDVSRLSSATYMVLIKGKSGQATELLIKE